MSQEPSTSRGPALRTPSPLLGSKLTPKQRNFALYLLGVARGLENKDSFSHEVYTTFCRLWDQNKDKHERPTAPGLNALRSIWTDLNSSQGLVVKPRKGGRKAREVREEIQAMLASSEASTREISADLKRVGVIASQSTVWRVAKKSGYFAYKEPKGQLLTEADEEARLKFAEECHRKMITRKTIDPHNVVWSDESMYGVGHIGNRQNTRHWRIKGDQDPYEMLRQIKFQGFHTHVFCCFSTYAGVIGPYYIEDIVDPADPNTKTLTSSKYIHMMRTIIVPELKERLGDKFETCWFQQDGAAPHTSGASLAYLREQFGNRLISNKCAFRWPPKSPDLNPLDFWFWRYTKEILYKDFIADSTELKLMIPLVFSNIQTDMIRSVVDHFIIRILAVLEKKGQHIELILDEFTRRYRESQGLQDICQWCETKHRCPCSTCKIACLSNVMRQREEELDNADSSDEEQ